MIPMKKIQTLPIAACVAISLFALAGCSRDEKTEGSPKPGASPAAGQNVAAAATPVRVAAAREETVTRSVPVTGSIAALQTVVLSPKLSARVEAVAGREGTPVRKGQVVVQQDISDFQIQLQQAEANLQAAISNLTQAQTQVGLQRAASAQGVQDARQQLASANANLALTRNPQRTQEIVVAENNVKQAQANYDKAESDRKRYEALLKEGATAQVTYDQYATQAKVNKVALDSAKQQLDIARQGGRVESVRNAETTVARAQSALRLAQANQQQVQVRQDAVKAQEATVAQQRATVANARLQIENASIKAPIDGVISARNTEPGQIAAPGQSVLTLIALDTVYFEASVPETSLASIKLGQSVDVKVDAYGEKSFPGKITRINPTGSATARTFNVRVEIPNSNGGLRPGLFARGNVIAERRQGVVIPKDALLTSENKYAVFVAENGVTAVRREVKIGIQTPETVEILSGVRSGESVIVVGQDSLRDGSPIKIQQNGQQTASL